ncbi:hypothetical protein [Microbacterium sp.]|uniref:hypothetical protein n=1 Tax=Microbacterium sp. TaxID=51671 RepID=UPI003C1F62D7
MANRQTRSLDSSRRPFILTIAVAIALASMTMAGVVGNSPAQAVEDPEPSPSSEPYEIQLEQPADEAIESRDLLEAAEAVSGTLQLLRFEGEEGVGEMVVAEGISAEELDRQAVDLFERVGTTVPAVASAIILSEAPLDAADLAAAGLAGTVQLLEQETDGFDLLTEASAESESDSAVSRGASESPAVAAVAAVVNDWSPYFPADWRAEGFNMNRCTNYSGGTCHSTIQAASLSQSVRWMDDHRPNLWPSSRFGLEFGVALKNYSFCDADPAYTPGYWLNPDYYEWSTGVPASAVPYLDTNRLSDACGSMSHELGVRYPSGLIAGATYGFTVTTKRNIYNSSSTYDASFQAVYDNCTDLGVGTSTDCMGLTNPSFPWGQRSATVVNTSRYFSFPKCARMHDKWTAPIQWANGGSVLMPAPLNYYDSCFSNSWY